MVVLQLGVVSFGVNQSCPDLVPAIWPFEALPPNRGRRINSGDNDGGWANLKP